MAESAESHEPSYYEVALTNRQVVIAFVVLLACLLAAFLSGVWLGRGAHRPVPPPTVAATPAPEPPLEQLSFFSKSEQKPEPAAARAAPRDAAPGSAPGELAPAAVPGTSLAPMIGGAPAVGARGANPSGTASPASAPAAPPVAARPPSAAKPATASAETTPIAASKGAASKPAPAPAASTAKSTSATPVAARLWVQVYSSTNGARAREIAAQLGKAGFTVQMTQIDKAGTANYRVRVGPYGARSDANDASQRLRRNYHLDTWVTDTP
ncbi:MAG: SPOR domain-containing protein [Thermoanaerobaculia bacterium]